MNAEETGARAKLLVVDDDLAVRRLLSAVFDADYVVSEAATAAEAMQNIQLNKPDLVLLDLGLPDRNGLEVIDEVRVDSNVPILVISAMGEESTKVEALEKGANDYVTKPFGVGELHARVRVALRQAQNLKTSRPRLIEAGGITIDRESRVVTVRGMEVRLTPTEYKLLFVLAENAGTVLTQRQLLLHVWGPEYENEHHYLRLYVGYLRRKIEEDPEEPKLLINEPRVGYRLIN